MFHFQFGSTAIIQMYYISLTAQRINSPMIPITRNDLLDNSLIYTIIRIYKIKPLNPRPKDPIINSPTLFAKFNMKLDTVARIQHI